MRKPDEPEWPEPMLCEPHEDHQGHMVGGCGCSVWKVTAANGDELELNPEPIDYRLDLAGQLMRVSGEHFAAYVGGYRLDGAEWFAGFATGRTERREEGWRWSSASGQLVGYELAEDECDKSEAGWEWYVTKQPLSAAADVPLYGEHYLTCPALSVRAKIARLHSDGDRDVIARELEQALTERRAAANASVAKASQDESAPGQARDQAPGRSQLGLF